MHSARTSSIAAAAAVAFAGLAAAPAHADSAADFYSGRTITIQVGFGAGGGYDVITRLVARHFGDHIPGKPTVVVQNMPGAGSLKVANYVYNVAPKDGSVLAVFASTAAVEPLYGDKKAKFDPRKFEWIANMHRDIEACGVWKGAGEGIKTLPDLLASKKTILFGATGPAATTSQKPLLIKHMFNANIKVIYGYKGTRDVNLAMQNGELNGTCGMFESSVKGAFAHDVKEGNLNLFVQFSLGRQPAIFGNATPFMTMVKKPDDKKIAKLLLGLNEITRPLAAPPETPKARVAALRKALMDTMKDPAMIADGKKIKLDFDPMTGEDVEKLFVEFYQTPPALVKKAHAYISPDPK
jgi:tripartite-type tricarboxylate transporter receptor subunit TctC